MKFSRRAFLGSSIGSGLLGLGRSAFSQSGLAGGEASRLAAAGFRGEIVTPASSRYAEARRMFVFNPRRSTRPQIIALCADEEDVRRALGFALEEGLELSVRAGGHDLLAASMCNGLVIDLSGLQSIDVDPAAQTVRVGGGVRAGKLNAALAEQGLAAALGCAGQVGVTGLVLGGGLGWLVGRHGAACDHLVAARLVTAGGQVLRVSEREHPELLWALRGGGGGNFGIVTEMTLGVHPLPGATQGVVALRLARVDDFLRRYRDYLASAGDDVDLETYISAPRGELMAFIKACYHGAPAQAERTLAPLRRVATFAADDLAPRPYTGTIDPTGLVLPLFRPSAPVRRDDDVPGLHVASASLPAIGEDAAEIVAERLAKAKGSWIAGFGHYIHGAASRVPARHSPMRRIDGMLTTYFIANWRRPEDAGPQMAWVDETVIALQPHAGPTYVNYLTTDDQATVRRAYGSAYPRLATVKRRYDPGNVFRRNRNIPPQSSNG